MPEITQAEHLVRFSRLPKWAQAELQQLHGALDETERELDELRSGKYGPADTDTFADPYSESPVALPKGGLVGFRLGYGEDDQVVVGVTDEGLEVRGLKGLIVAPSTSTSVTIELRRR